MYHINPNTGNPGICRAGSPDGCPFGTLSEHHESADGARKAFEFKMSGETLQAHTKLYKPRENDSEIVANVPKKVATNAPEVWHTRTGEETDFEAADAQYYQLTNDPYTSRPEHRTEYIYKVMKKRDALARKLGLPTIQDAIYAEQAPKLVERDRQFDEIMSLRSSIKDDRVGPGTDRERLYKMESEFYQRHRNPHPMYCKPEDRIPSKEIWELNKSTSKYQLDKYNNEVEELKGTFAFGIKKRMQIKADLDSARSLRDYYAKSLKDAEDALKNSEQKRPGNGWSFQ